MNRRGVSLIELLVAVAILAVFIGMILSAVHQVRVAAARTRFVNQIHQVSVAYASYCSATTRPALAPGAVFNELRPHLGSPESIAPDQRLLILGYMNTDDPSYTYFTERKGNTNVSLNSPLIKTRMRPENIPDGASNTILFAERYAQCGTTDLSWSLYGTKCYDGNTRIPCPQTPTRTATFADSNYTDIIPVAGSVPNTVTGSVAGLTFQVRVRPDECDARMAQGVFPAGLIVGLADGSVRVIGKGVSPDTFWATVTPAGGEVIGDW